MTTIYHYFCHFKAKSCNKTCLELGEKAPKNEKNVVKRHPYKEKVAKSPQYSQKKICFIIEGGGATAYTLADAHAIAWL